MAKEQAPPMDDDTEVEVMEVESTAIALSANERATIDIQIATAKQYPRSIDKALKEVEALACRDEETAASMFYSLPRAGKDIEGPSARLAEIMAYSWGNMRVDSDIVGEDDTHITAVGTCFDLEKNVAIRIRVRRRITDKQGRRFNEDMVTVTGNAAISIAVRNSIMKVIPRVFTQGVYEQARQTSVGKAGTLSQKRQNALNWFTKVGLPEEKVFELLAVNGLEDIGIDELIRLRGLRTALKEGDTTVEMLLESGIEAAVKDQTAALKAEIAEKKAKAEAKAKAEKKKAEKKEEPEPESEEEGEDEGDDGPQPWT